MNPELEHLKEAADAELELMAKDLAKVQREMSEILQLQSGVLRGATVEEAKSGFAPNAYVAEKKKPLGKFMKAFRTHMKQGGAEPSLIKFNPSDADFQAYESADTRYKELAKREAAMVKRKLHIEETLGAAKRAALLEKIKAVDEPVFVESATALGQATMEANVFKRDPRIVNPATNERTPQYKQFFTERREYTDAHNISMREYMHKLVHLVPFGEAANELLARLSALDAVQKELANPRSAWLPRLRHISELTKKMVNDGLPAMDELVNEFVVFAEAIKQEPKIPALEKIRWENFIVELKHAIVANSIMDAQTTLRLNEKKAYGDFIDWSEAVPFIKQYFSFQDAPKMTPERKADALEQHQKNPRATKYGLALKELIDQYSEQMVSNVAEQIKVECLDALNRLQITPSDDAESASWAFWDLAKQFYYISHPNESDPAHYIIADPFLSPDKSQEIVDRNIGWEARGAYHDDPPRREFFNNLDRIKPEFPRIKELLEMSAGSSETLHAYELAELGRLLREIIA